MKKLSSVIWNILHTLKGKVDDIGSISSDSLSSNSDAICFRKRYESWTQDQKDLFNEQHAIRVKYYFNQIGYQYIQDTCTEKYAELIEKMLIKAKNEVLYELKDKLP